VSHDAASCMGDLARAFARLRPEDEATRKAIVGLLLRPGDDALHVEAFKAPLPPPVPAPARSIPVPPTVQAHPTRPHAEPDGIPIPLNIKSARNPRPALPDWLDTAPPLPSEPPPEVTMDAPAPLLDPLRSRAVLGSLAAAPGDGPIDIDGILNSVARGQALLHLPYRRVPTLARGVQLLVDRSDAMLPFHLDLAGLERELVSLAGGAMEVLHFVACPSRGCGQGVRRRWKPYGPERVPRIGARILCVTDLGLGVPPPGEAPAHPEEWIAFAGRLRRAGCSVGALVPYPPERWPFAVARVMDLFHWDRSLTVARAARGVLQRG
jgi:hypothetical protein